MKLQATRDFAFMLFLQQVPIKKWVSAAVSAPFRYRSLAPYNRIGARVLKVRLHKSGPLRIWTDFHLSQGMTFAMGMIMLFPDAVNKWLR